MVTGLRRLATIFNRADQMSFGSSGRKRIWISISPRKVIVLNLKSINQALYHLSQVTTLVAAFITIYEPQLRGGALKSITQISGLVLCIYACVRIHRREYLSKTISEIHDDIKIRPLGKLRIELTLNLLIIIFAQMADSHY